MNDNIAKYLGISARDKNEIEKAIGPFKTITEFIESVVDATKDGDFIKSVITSTPWWLQAAGESLAETAPPIKFLTKLLGKLSKINDQDKLAYLAFTIAYQRSLEKGILYIGLPAGLKKLNLKKSLSPLTEDYKFGNYSLKDPLNHPFIKEADKLTLTALSQIGYSTPDCRKILGEVHMRFPYLLKTIFTHPNTRDKYTSFAQSLSYDTNEERVFSAWKDHFEYQRYLFEDKPVFGEENFSLSDIYVETECGVIECGELPKNHRINKSEGRYESEVEYHNPFDEKCGGRHSLIESVMTHIGDEKFREAIVVQGPAGSGKSAFTLRLSVELLRQGLYPIRIRFRDLALQFLNIEDALPEAVRFWDIESKTNDQPLARPDELFINFSIFDQSVKFGRATICPWVLILDGWDEVSIAAQKGFEVRVNEILTQVYDRFVMRGNRPPVRVILTGRPSDAVLSSSFIKKHTKLMTIKPLKPTHLKPFITKLAYHLSESTDSMIMDIDKFKPIIENYQKNFKKLNHFRKNIIQGKTFDNVEIFGLPLLTHLAVRLILNWPEKNVQNIIDNPTTLYRLLTDLTCSKGGRYGKDVFESSMSGKDIRGLLHETATAMTAYGKDSIPYDELDIRLSQLNEDLIDRVQNLTKDHPVTSLMINFFFKGGQKQLGAEFLHKSFREFLFAEAIVETLKEYARKSQTYLQERDENYYWKDFDSIDIRYDFSRRLGKLIAPQWLSKEVCSFLEGLINWELSRTKEEVKRDSNNLSTEPLDMLGWERVRDGLVDLWGWWGDGVHLRPQPNLQGKKIASWDKQVVEEFVLWSMNQHEEMGTVPAAARTVTMDSHLGNGLFQLNVLVHHYINSNSQDNRWYKMSVEEIKKAKIKPRTYQSLGKKNKKVMIRFRPTGKNRTYFLNYVHRINSAGWYPGTIFPSNLTIKSVDFDNTALIMAGFANSSLDGSTFRDSNLVGSVFINSDLTNVDFSNAELRLVGFINSNIENAIFDEDFKITYLNNIGNEDEEDDDGRNIYVKNNYQP